MQIQVSIVLCTCLQEQKIVQPHYWVKFKKSFLQEVISSWMLSNKPDFNPQFFCFSGLFVYPHQFMGKLHTYGRISHSSNNVYHENNSSIAYIIIEVTNNGKRRMEYKREVEHVCNEKVNDQNNNFQYI